MTRQDSTATAGGSPADDEAAAYTGTIPDLTRAERQGEHKD